MKIIVGMSGASGAILGIRLLEVLRDAAVETHLVMSKWAQATIKLETTHTVRAVARLAAVVHAPTDLAACISSGSYRTDGMVVIPCSMKTLAGIRTGVSSNLLERAADVTLKERRKLILVPRESPLSEIHLENMLALSRMGAVILPPMPAFYTRPHTLEDMVDQVVGRVLDHLGVEIELGRRWAGTGDARADED
jgi:4-hydroxy-3-polyprenylbenzoate decarboxylase